MQGKEENPFYKRGISPFPLPLHPIPLSLKFYFVAIDYRTMSVSLAIK